GIMLLSPVATLDLADLDRMHRTNIRGTFVVARLAANRVRPGGAIVNVSTTVTRTQLPTYGAYVASKAAVGALGPALARDLLGRADTVNPAAAGQTATPLFLEGKSEQLAGQLAAATPMYRLSPPAAFAATVAFLAGPARWVNGQTLFTNGG